MKRFILLGFLLIAAVSLQAQELTVKRMEVAVGDLTASVQPRNDLNGNACALVKVQLATPGARFEGSVIGDVEFKTGEYWVYMSGGSYMLNIKHPSFLPLFVNFRDYDIKRVEQKTTYVLTLLMPQTGAIVKTQKFIINYSPADAIVIVDSKSHWGNGHLELDLEVGSHDYQIVAKGYEVAEGSVKLNENAPKTITEHLVATKTEQPQAQQAQVVVQQPVQQQPVQQETPSVSVTSSIETFTVNGVSFNMVRVEGGTFQMGSDDSEADSDEKPVHQVTLSTFSIGETEVTQALWKAVMGSNPSFSKGGSLPVEMVSWNDCQTFIQKLNQLTGKQFRLPTEAEWEYAARGGSKSRGYKYSGSNTIGDVAWYEKDNNQKVLVSHEYGEYSVLFKEVDDVKENDLKDLVQYATKSGRKILVASHQDSKTGSVAENQRICEKRAANAAKLLNNMGVEASQIEIVLRGDCNIEGWKGFCIVSVKVEDNEVLMEEEKVYDGNSSDKTHPVKTKQANELGLYDMSGNVWEWCEDWYGPYSSSAQTNPTGPSSDYSRVTRGGSWRDAARGCRVSGRIRGTLGGRYFFFGLRLAL